jgi:hypothetical protein
LRRVYYTNRELLPFISQTPEGSTHLTSKPVIGHNLQLVPSNYCPYNPLPPILVKPMTSECLFYRVFHLKCNSNHNSICKVWWYQYNKTDELSFFSLPLLSVSPVNTVRRRTCFLLQTLPVPRNFVTSRCTVVLFGTSLSRCALINASRTAANDFDAK